MGPRGLAPRQKAPQSPGAGRCRPGSRCPSPQAVLTRCRNTGRGCPTCRVDRFGTGWCRKPAWQSPFAGPVARRAHRPRLWRGVVHAARSRVGRIPGTGRCAQMQSSIKRGPSIECSSSVDGPELALKVPIRRIVMPRHGAWSFDYGERADVSALTPKGRSQRMRAR